MRAYENALAQERSLLEKARSDLAAAESTKSKLEQVLPHYVEQERAFEKLQKDGFAGRVMATDKPRERIEKEQDLRTQEFVIRSSRALIAQSEAKDRADHGGLPAAAADRARGDREPARSARARSSPSTSTGSGLSGAARAAGGDREGPRDPHRRHGGRAGDDPHDARARGRQAASPRCGSRIRTSASCGRART